MSDLPPFENLRFEVRDGVAVVTVARPKALNALNDRTLDEMMRDYLRYWHAGRGNSGWEDHNRLMMYWACLGTAEKKGWDYVRSFEWWPQVEAISFTKETPWLPS